MGFYFESNACRIQLAHAAVRWPRCWQSGSARSCRGRGWSVCRGCGSGLGATEGAPSNVPRSGPGSTSDPLRALKAARAPSVLCVPASPISSGPWQSWIREGAGSAAAGMDSERRRLLDAESGDETPAGLISEQDAYLRWVHASITEFALQQVRLIFPAVSTWFCHGCSPASDHVIGMTLLLRIPASFTEGSVQNVSSLRLVSPKRPRLLRNVRNPARWG